MRPGKLLALALAFGLSFAAEPNVADCNSAYLRKERIGKPHNGADLVLLTPMKYAFAQAGPRDPKHRPKTAAPKPKLAAPRGEPEVVLTHPDKVLFPEAGLTKRDLFMYYLKIADRLLPYLKDRPVTLERLPEGLTGDGAPHFWQKNTPESYPDWITRIALPTEKGETVHYALVNDTPTLLYLVNQGTLTFHVWSSRVQDLDRPDFVLFDLDPGNAKFADVVEVAKGLRTMLKGEGIETFVKTSGKSGLHVLTPWSGNGGYDEARAWAHEIALRVAGERPNQVTVEIRKANRGERVYIDVMQNVRGHHAVPPYVVRAIPSAAISTPLDWKEVTPALNLASFTPRTIFRRLSRRKTDPLAGLLPAGR